MTSLPIPKAGDEVTASLWNQYAEAINRTWAMETDENFRLTKSEPWRLEFTGSTDPNPIVAGPFNAPVYRVFVDRGDGWDWGSTASPRAFYLAGTFTSYGSKTALRAAKFYKSPATGGSNFSSTFAAENQFNGTTNFIKTTRDGNIIYGATVPRSRNGAGTNYAWILNPVSGIMVGGFNAVPSNAFLTTGLSSLACIDGYLAAMNPTRTVIYNLSSGSSYYLASDNNSHNIAGDYSSFYATGRRVNMFGLTDPKAFHKFDNVFSQDSTWSTNGGNGSGADLFSLCLSQKQIWDGDYDPITGGPKLITVAATKEYTGVDFKWNDEVYAADSSGYGAVFRLNSDAILYNPTMLYEEDFTFHLDSSVAGCSPRLEIFFTDSYDRVWFGGGVNVLNQQRNAPQSVTPQRLYRFNTSTQDFTVFDGFNGPVWDCQFFCVTEAGVHQFIVVGDFTEYNGEPAEYMMFMDDAGNRLSDLEWN